MIQSGHFSDEMEVDVLISSTFDNQDSLLETTHSLIHRFMKVYLFRYYDYFT